jgi:hypothetical protein
MPQRFSCTQWMADYPPQQFQKFHVPEQDHKEKFFLLKL